MAFTYGQTQFSKSRILNLSPLLPLLVDESVRNRRDEVLGADARLTFLHSVDVETLQEGLCAETVASAQTPAWRPNSIFSCSFCRAGCAWMDSSDMPISDHRELLESVSSLSEKRF
jgi:hypothetical protein